MSEARVVQVTGRTALVETEDGDTLTCAVRGIVHHRKSRDETTLVVGDLVEISTDPGAGPCVEKVRPRRNVLQRRSGRSRQAIAANVDGVLVTVGLAEPPLRTGLIDRYLVAAHQSAIEPIVCLNKADLVSAADAASVRDMYGDLGYSVAVTSAVTGLGIDELARLLSNRMSVFAGPSGGGKSSLINRLHPSADIRTANVNPKTGKGRHTTTSAVARRLPCGGFMVDTPGVRQFALWAVDRGDAARFFPEFVQRAHACRFGNCTHSHETDCAIRDAVDGGTIDPRRYRAYLSILNAASDDS